MAQATFSIRMDETLKRQFDLLCAEFGMNTSTAINVFARAVVRERRIPFEISATQKKDVLEEGRKSFYAMRETAKKNRLQEMTIEEINEEINLAREEIESRKRQ